MFCLFLEIPNRSKVITTKRLRINNFAIGRHFDIYGRDPAHSLDVLRCIEMRDSQVFRLSLFNEFRHFFISFFNIYSFIIFLLSTSNVQKNFFFLIFVECLPHGKFNSGPFMKSNFLGLDRYLRRYSEKTK